MTEDLGVQPEEKPQDKVRSEFKDFIKDADIGTPKYHALDDFVAIERLKHQDPAAKPESIETRQSIIDKTSARSPLYREALGKIMEFATGFQLAYEDQWLKMSKASEGQLPVRLEDIWLVVDWELAKVLNSRNLHRNNRRKSEEKSHA